MNEVVGRLFGPWMSYKVLISLLSGFFLLLALCAPILVQAQNPNDQDAKGQRFVTIDFNDVDINLFIKYISELTGKNFIVDRTVKGKVTIISPTRITEEDAYRVFESVLEVHGFTTVPSGSVTKIIPSVQARSKSIETIIGDQLLYPEDKVVTQLIPLAHSDPEAMKRLLAPLVSKTSVVIAHTESGMLILTEFLSNINRLMEIIKVVDVPSVGEELVVLPLQYATAGDISKALAQLFVRSSAAKGQRVESIKIIPYERTNSLIIFASKSSIAKVRDLLVKIDTEAPKGTGKIQVVYLQHANAEELLKVLTSLPDTKSAGKDPKAIASAPPISTNVRIMADIETNSLIIIGPREEYLILQEVIEKLDIPRRMVYIEALIMEVKVTKSFALGVQWGGGGTFADGTGKMFTGFSGTGDSPYSDLQGDNSLLSDAAVLGSGFTFGVIKQGIQIGDMLFPNLGAVVKAFKDDSDVEIIATPQILTTDNKEASILVGENVPYITSQNTTSGLQDYTNYEYKDVATSLKILPQINQSDLVRLEIGVEVIKLKDQASQSLTPTTLTRTATTTVVVHNEETVVIGGMIGQDTASSEYKVPLLGDIPLIGWLFKSRGEFKDKTNLFIFITPHIVENKAQLASMYLNKRDVMDYVKSGSSAIPDMKFKGLKNKKHAVIMTDIGFASMQKNDLDGARLYFGQALKIDPEHASAILNLGVLNEKEGNTGNAIKEYQRVLELQPVEDGEGAEQENQHLLDVQDFASKNLQRLGFGDARFTPQKEEKAPIQ